MAGGSICPSCGHAHTSLDDEWCTQCGARLAAPVEKTAPGEPAAQVFAKPPPTQTEPSSGPLPEAGVDGAAPNVPRTLPAGTVIDKKYSIVRVLGEGGMGVVYLAEDIHTGVEIVLKAVRPELVHRRDVRDRTMAEGRTLARIDHPNVVHLNAVVTDDTGLWLVMQYIEGESLDRTIKRHKQNGEKVAFPVAIDIFRQVLAGVAAAHRDGVIHRDLKPANVLVRKKDGVAKVTDFGIAKPEQQARVGQGNTKGVIGSLWYMSPEQVQGKRDLDKRLDIYSLGILLFELLSGRVPFTAESSYEIMRLHVEEPLPKISAERKDVPAWIDEVLERACAKKREDRYSSCEEFLAAIDEHVGPLPTRAASAALKPSSVGVPPPSDPEAPQDKPPAAAQTIDGTRSGSVAPPTASKPSRAWLFALLGLIVLAGAGAGIYALGGFTSSSGSKSKPAKASSSALEPSATTISSSDAAPSASAPPKIDPLARLEGKWKSEAGTEFDAVRVGDKVEFRVVDPKQLAPADYAAGEARFILRVGPSESSYLVEEKMRPGATVPFDPKARTSCQEIWTEVDDKPLLASWEADGLHVDFAKVHFAAHNFKIEDDKIVQCVKLAGAARGRGRTTLKR